MQGISRSQKKSVKASTKKSPIKDVRKKTVSRTAQTHKVSLRSTKGISSPYVKKIKRYAKQGVKSMLLSKTFHSGFKVLSVALISFGVLYSSFFFISKTFANEVVVSRSEIISRVAKLTALPKEDPYEIVRVQDEEDLKKQNEFYKDISEGDYILIYKDVAVIYDLRNDAIKGVKRQQ